MYFDGNTYDSYTHRPQSTGRGDMGCLADTEFYCGALTPQQLKPFLDQKPLIKKFL